MVQGRAARRLALGVTLVALGGCRGGASERAATNAAARPAATTTTGAALATTTTRPTGTTRTATRTATPPRVLVAADGTPAPRIVDTGDNYVGIWHSLDGYRVWLEQHHPDPALVPRVWVPGTPVAERFRKHLGQFRARHVRWIDVDDATTARVVSVVDHQVTLLVDETFSGVRLVDEQDRVLDTAPAGVEHVIALLDRDAQGHWRIASVEPRLSGDTEVHL